MILDPIFHDNNISTREIVDDGFLQIYICLGFFNGIILSLFPDVGQNFYGLSAKERNKPIFSYCTEATGCFILELSLVVYLTTNGIASPLQATGISLIPDIYFMLKNIANGTFAIFGPFVSTFMITLVGLSFACMHSLVTGTGSPILAGTLMSLLPAIKGFATYSNPVSSGKRMMKADLEQDDKTKTMYRESGIYKMLSASYKGALVAGVDPFKAVGLMSLLAVFFSVDSIFIKDVHKVYGNSPASSYFYLTLHAIAGVYYTFFH